MVIFGSERKPVNYQDYNLVVYALGITLLSYGAAAVVSVFVEFPIGNLEQTLFKMAGLRRQESARTGGEEEQNVPKDDSSAVAEAKDLLEEESPLLPHYNPPHSESETVQS